MAQVAGYDVVTQAAQVRASVGVLTEQHGLYGRMPADDYLDFFGQLYNLDATFRKERIQRLLEQFGLFEARPGGLASIPKACVRSWPWRERCCMSRRCCSWMSRPSAMDPESARLVRDSIRALRSSERTIILCTHNLAEAEELADQIAIIRAADYCPGFARRP